MISWMILSCVAEYTELPHRFAGTCSTYSKNAMPQLARMTRNNGLFLNFKCPYHANVMKTFEQDNSAMGNQRVWMSVFINYPSSPVCVGPSERLPATRMECPKKRPPSSNQNSNLPFVSTV